MSNKAPLVISVVGSLALLLSRGYFEATQERRLAAGVLGSILYLFVLNVVGNFKRGEVISLFEVGISLIFTVFIMMAIHPASVSLCILLSAVITYETSKVAQEKYSKGK